MEDRGGRPSPIEPAGAFDGLVWSAILRGGVLDNVLSIGAQIVIMLFIAGPETFSEDQETANRAFDQAAGDPEFLFWTFVVGLAITAYAGFWAARRAGTLHVRHGGWTAVAAAVISSLFLLVPGATAGPGPPLWYDALALAFLVPAGLLGGWLASRVRKRAD